MLLLSAQLLSTYPPPATQSFANVERIVSATCKTEITKDGATVEVALLCKQSGPKQRTIKTSFDSLSSAGKTQRLKVMDNGRLVLLPFHHHTHYNTLIGFYVKGNKLVVDESYAEVIAKSLPRKLRRRFAPDNVSLHQIQGDHINIDFRTSDEKDGVKANCTVHNLVWHCNQAKYWRDPAWDGVHHF